MLTAVSRIRNDFAVNVFKGNREIIYLQMSAPGSFHPVATELARSHDLLSATTLQSLP